MLALSMCAVRTIAARTGVSIGTVMSLVAPKVLAARTTADKLVGIKGAKAASSNRDACDSGEDGIGTGEGAPNNMTRGA